jgi:hypothetical protein
MDYRKKWLLIFSMILVLAMTISGWAVTKFSPEHTKSVRNSENAPIIVVRVTGSPRLPAGTEVTVSVGGDCDTATPVKITIGPAGGGTARVDLNGCRPTNKTYGVANALVGPDKETAKYYYGKGSVIGVGGTTSNVILRPK